MTARKGLGRGLGGLISDAAPAELPAEPSDVGIRKVRIDSIVRNPWQPRHAFDEETLQELTESIRRHGILQPLLVRTAASGYTLIAGERRLRGAIAAGLTDVPVVVVEASDSDALELALIENLQRQDLNVIEEAEGYHELAERFDLTQELIAERVGKSRAAVANAMRLLALPDEARTLLANGLLSTGHAKVILSAGSETLQTTLARRVVSDSLTIRQLQKLIDRSTTAPRKLRSVKADIPQGYLSHLSDCLHRHFGTSVRISPCKTFANGKKGKGTIEIDFFSNEDLDRVLQVLGISPDDNE